MQRNDGAGVGRGERDLGLAAAARVREHRGEERLAGDEALAGAEQLVHEAAALAGRGTVAEHGFHLHRGFLVHHRSGFGHGALARVELDLDELHVLAVDLVVDLVGAARGGRRRRVERSAAAGAEFGAGRERNPFGETLAPDVAVRILRGLRHRGGMIERAHLLAVVADEPLVHGCAPLRCWEQGRFRPRRCRCPGARRSRRAARVPVRCRAPVHRASGAPRRYRR